MLHKSHYMFLVVPYSRGRFTKNKAATDFFLLLIDLRGTEHDNTWRHGPIGALPLKFGGSVKLLQTEDLGRGRLEMKKDDTLLVVMLIFSTRIGPYLMDIQLTVLCILDPF